MKPENIGRTDRDILAALMDGIEHISVAHDLIFITVPRSRFFFKKLLHPGACGDYAFNFVGRFGTLDFCNLDKAGKFHGLLSDKQILMSLTFVDLCNQVQNIRIPFFLGEFTAVK